MNKDALIKEIATKLNDWFPKRTQNYLELAAISIVESILDAASQSCDVSIKVDENES